MSNTRLLTQLHKKLNRHFAKEELRTICFQLGIEYDDLSGEGRSAKARELTLKLQRDERIDELVTICTQERPQVIWTYQAHLFICYKRDSTSDNALALYLHAQLMARGHEAFIDQSMRAGTAWLEEIDQQIKRSDFIVVLLSSESAQSEMVQNEVHRAYEYFRHQQYPILLSIRMNYEEMLPYSIAAFVNPRHYLIWHDETDNEDILGQLIDAIDGRLPQQDPTRFTPTQKAINISEDGHSIQAQDTPHPPLPEFDPRLLTRLRTPGGAVRLRDKFYVERQADNQLKRELDTMEEGVTITIRAPRQTGKTSLLMRGIQYARQELDAKTIFIDLQNMGHNPLADIDTFLHALAQNICYELRQDEAPLNEAWQSSFPPQQKLTFWLEDTILSQYDDPILLAIDEADALLQTSFYRDVFAMLRSWHNRRAVSEELDKLSIAMVISTEPYLLIDDINQSPFNVGLELSLPDFDLTQVTALNRQHGDPITIDDLATVINLLNGHPYLTRKLLYHMVADKLSWQTIQKRAIRDNGPFGDHLRRLLWGLQDRPQLKIALKQVMKAGRCQDDKALFRLSRAGLIKGSGDLYAFRCDLYRQYFEEKLA